jgi:hypothetical protein
MGISMRSRAKLCAGLLVLAISAAPVAGAGESSGTEILSTAGQWRYFVVMRDAVYGSAKENKPREAKCGHRFDTEPPPAGWTAPVFDDSDWGRKPGPFFPGYGFQQQDTLEVLYLRGSFAVTDPDKVPELVLSAVYRGGVAAYLQLGRLGNKTTYIHLMCRSNHGNNQTMVRWMKDGDGYKHDFSVLERYLDRYIEKALLDKGARAKLGEEKAAKLQGLIDARTRAHICASGDLGAMWYSCSGWQERSVRLFSAAGEAAGISGGR